LISVINIIKAREQSNESGDLGPLGQPKRPARHHLLTPLFVWGVWVAMLVAALAFVERYGSNVPSWDGWDMVPSLTGHQAVTAEWLWSQHNEHRVPLPRLILLGLHQITGINFKTPMFFNVLVTGALALAMILVAKRLRGGQMSYTEAFFPLILLNWGQAANLIWGWQIQFYASMALYVVALLFIVQSEPRLRLRNAAVLGVCLILLPLCGANGLVLAPPLALWLGYSAVVHWHAEEPHARRDSLLVLALSMSALLLSALYLVGWERVPYFGFGFGLWSIGTAAKAATMGFGPGIVGLDLRLWPTAFWPIPCLAVLCFLLGSVAVLLMVVWSRPQERLRALGLFSFLVALGCLGLALGLGRNGFETRYVTLMLPTWLCVYFICSIYARPKLNVLSRALLLALTVVTLWPNTRFGLNYGTHVRSRLAGFENEMVAGVPGSRLIFRYWQYLHPHHDLLNEYMPMLRQAGVGSFRFLQENPAFREVSIPLVPQSLNKVRWEAGTFYATGRWDESYMLFSLPKAEYAYAIRLKYTYWNDDNILPLISLYWRDEGQKDFTKDRYGQHSATGDYANWVRGTWGRTKEPESTLTLWVCDTVKDIRLHPDRRPCMFKLSELALLIPPTDHVSDAEKADNVSYRPPWVDP
jgi:hypothetical protein